MSKRRNVSNENLDEIVRECLKKRNCGKTLLLFKNHIDPMRRNSSLSSNVFVKFEEFLRHKSQKSQIEDDLGFEINFASFQNEPKVILKHHSPFKNKKWPKTLSSIAFRSPHLLPISYCTH